MPKENQCTGSYPVSGYTRGNGVEVDSYIRNCWKHSGGTSSNDTLFEYGQKNICKIDENIEKLSNQNEVSDSEVDNIYSNLFEVINVILKISDEVIKMYNNMPTELNQERIVQGNKLNKAKNNLEEMIYKAIGTSFNIQKVSNKNWSQVDTKDKNYYAKQKKYITIENIRKRISDDLTNLYRSVLSDSKNEFKNAKNNMQDFIEPFEESKKSAGIIADFQKDTILKLNADDNYMPIINNKLYQEEKEYYSYFLNNVEIDTTNNEKFEVNKISKKNLKNFIKNKYNDVNDDTIVVQVKKNAPLYKKVHGSNELKTKIADLYKSGKIKSGQIVKTDISFTKRPIFTVIGKATIYIDGIYNDYITGYIVDYYDFDKANISMSKNKLIIYVNNNAVKQQKVYGTKYVILIPLKIYKKDL